MRVSCAHVSLQSSEHHPPLGDTSLSIAITNGSQDALTKAFEMFLGEGPLLRQCCDPQPAPIFCFIYVLFLPRFGKHGAHQAPPCWWSSQRTAARWPFWSRSLLAACPCRGFPRMEVCLSPVQPHNLLLLREMGAAVAYLHVPPLLA